MYSMKKSQDFLFQHWKVSTLDDLIASIES